MNLSFSGFSRGHKRSNIVNVSDAFYFKAAAASYCFVCLLFVITGEDAVPEETSSRSRPHSALWRRCPAASGTSDPQQKGLQSDFHHLYKCFLEVYNLENFSFYPDRHLSDFMTSYWFLILTTTYWKYFFFLSSEPWCSRHSWAGFIYALQTYRRLYRTLFFLFPLKHFRASEIFLA